MTTGAELLEAANRFPGPEALANALAVRLREILEYALEHRGHAGLVVSGGSTPLPLFHRLSAEELPWERVTVTLADERRVPEDDPHSNAQLVRPTLLQGPAAAARFVPLHRSGADARADEAACAAALGTLARPFDAVVLGMGDDGHTASLFPGAPELAEALDPDTPAQCRSITAPAQPRERLTLTLPALLDSRCIALHITGEDKWSVLEQALASGDPRRYPVCAVLLQRRTPVHVYWSP